MGAATEVELDRKLLIWISTTISQMSKPYTLLQVGAATEVELEDRKLRVEDAKNATFAAVEVRRKFSFIA